MSDRDAVILTMQIDLIAVAFILGLALDRLDRIIRAIARIEARDE